MSEFELEVEALLVSLLNGEISIDECRDRPVDLAGKTPHWREPGELSKGVS